MELCIQNNMNKNINILTEAEDNLETQKILERWKYPDGQNHVNFHFWKKKDKE